ncbi:MAG: hypothetical protein M1812_007190 [Candelaria pacifica]|nr:MAG: hypothetical protein M1812_007190 [Candelaria pacifica]
MEMQFRNLDRAIESQPMPSQFRDTKALVYCNDCAAKTSVDYHWLGLKCAVCDSYNTAQIQILSGPDPQSQTTPHSEVASHPPGPSDLIAFPPTGIYSPSRGRHTRSIPASHLSTPSSSGRRPTSSASAMESARYSPYPIPQRAGRSVSPFRSFGGDLIRATAATAEEAEPINTDDEEEEEVDFWGGGTRSRSRSALRDTDEQGSPEDDDDSIEDNDEDTDEEDGDDGDANDQMELLGHR